MSTQSAAQRTAAQGTVNAYAQAQSNRARTAKPEGIGQPAQVEPEPQPTPMAELLRTILAECA